MRSPRKRKCLLEELLLGCSFGVNEFVSALSLSLYLSGSSFSLAEERANTHPETLHHDCLVSLRSRFVIHLCVCPFVHCFVVFLGVLREDCCSCDTIDWASLVFCNQDLLSIFWTVFSCLAFSRTSSVHLLLILSLSLSLICFMERISSCWLLFSCVCWLLFFFFFFFYLFYLTAHSTTPAGWNIVSFVALFLFSSLFFYHTSFSVAFNQDLLCWTCYRLYSDREINLTRKQTTFRGEGGEARLFIKSIQSEALLGLRWLYWFFVLNDPCYF